MRLGDKIKQYRTEHELSLRQFAERCGVSHTYIGVLESGINPNTDKPLVPNLTRLSQIAKGMNLSVEELITEVDDFDIAIEPNTYDRLKAYYEKLNREGIAKLVEYAEDLATNPRYKA